MNTQFQVLRPNEIMVQLSVQLSIGEARKIRDDLQMMRDATWASCEFRRELTDVIDKAEKHFDAYSRPPDGGDG